MPRIVQIGLGRWGQNHTRILDGKLSAVCDSDISQLEKAPDMPKYQDYKNMVKEIKPDIAIVTTPTTTHQMICIHLLENKVNVFVEKPFTSTVGEGMSLISLAEKNNVKITCGYIERFNPVTKYIKMQDSTPNLLEFHRSGCMPPHITDGIILDTMVHDIETACHIFEEYPLTVNGSFRNMSSNKDDLAVATLVFKKGMAVLVTNWNTNMKMRTIHATYADKIIRGDFVGKTIKRITPDAIVKREFPNSNPLKDELEHFIDCVIHDKSPQVSAGHANRITDIANAILS